MDHIKINVPHTEVHRLARRFLEPEKDLLVLTIGMVLFGVMLRTLASMIREVFKPLLDFRGVIAEILFMLVMVEVVRLLIIYLEQHRVAVDFMLELGIVATLREIVLRGVTEIKLAGGCSFDDLSACVGRLAPVWRLAPGQFASVKQSMRRAPETFWTRSHLTCLAGEDNERAAEKSPRAPGNDAERNGRTLKDNAPAP